MPSLLPVSRNQKSGPAMPYFRATSTTPRLGHASLSSGVVAVESSRFNLWKRARKQIALPAPKYQRLGHARPCLRAGSSITIDRFVLSFLPCSFVYITFRHLLTLRFLLLSVLKRRNVALSLGAVVTASFLS